MQLMIIIHGNLMKARYRNKIVRQHIEPFMRTHGPGVIFQLDNAQPYIANVVLAELQ